MLNLPAHRPYLIGVVHLLPLPGAPRYGGRFAPVVEAAVTDAAALAEGGADAIIVENFGDAPFHASDVPAETVAGITLAAREVVSAAGERPVGINVLRNDVRSALGICAVTGATFVRVNVHTGAAVTDQGLIEGRAAETLRERARICPEVALLADVHVKHATPLGDETAAESAADLVGRGLADAVIVSGTGTGRAPEADAVNGLREHVSGADLLLGSGVPEDNAAALCASADGAIVGTWLKRDGRVDAPVDVARVRRMIAAFEAVRAR